MSGPFRSARHVDLIAEDPQRNAVVLILTQVAGWTGTSRDLVSLQEKVNAYIAFVTSGQIYQKLPSSRGKPIVFQLHYREAPPPNVVKAVQMIGQQLAAREGISFELQSV